MNYTIVLTAAAAALLAAAPASAAPHEGRAFLHDYDADHDGAVTRAEFEAGRTARFAATDTNGDGWVSDAEYLAEFTVRFEAELAASNESAAKKDEERVRQVRQTHVRFGVLDRDKDGRMTKADYDASGARAFDGQDDDKDGIITAADVAATSARRAEAQAKRDQ